jgi:DNA-binding NarL/FixJ family response regulator
VRRLFERSDWKVCGDAADIAEAMAMAAEFNPDIIVMDYPFPPLADYLTALPLKEAAPSARIILFTFADVVHFLHPQLPMFSAVVSKTEPGTLLAKAQSLVGNA